MSTWIQENILKNLNAFQLVMLILGYFMLSPFVAFIGQLMDGVLILTIYHVFVYICFSLVIICFLIVALGVYNKDKDAKIETSKLVEFTPTEKFTLKQAANTILSMVGISGDKVVPAPEAESWTLENIPLDVIKSELARRQKEIG